MNTHYVMALKAKQLLLVMLMLVTWPALALDLTEAKSSGLVGEVNTGYLAAVTPSAEVDELIVTINDLRREEYQRIADKNGITRKAVEVRAGQKAIEKTAPGDYIDTGTGWTKK